MVQLREVSPTLYTVVMLQLLQFVIVLLILLVIQIIHLKLKSVAVEI